MTTLDECVLSLDPFDFVPEGLGRFIHDLKEHALKALCPCHAVVWYRIPQFSTIAPLLDEARAGRYVCIPMAELSRYRDGETDVLPSVKPGAVPEDVTAFVVPELLRNRAELLAHRGLQEFFELPGVVTHFFPAYKVGRPLHAQPGHETFSVPLENAFRFLWRFGLVSGDVLQRRSAHSSVLMMMRGILGVRQYADLISYIANPPWFFTSVVMNSLVAEQLPGTSGTLARQLHKVFAELFHEQCRPGTPHLPDVPNTTITHRLSQLDLQRVFQHLREKHAPYTASLPSFLASIEPLAEPLARVNISPHEGTISPHRETPGLATTDGRRIEEVAEGGTQDDWMDRLLDRIADLGFGVTAATIVIPPIIFVAAAVWAGQSEGAERVVADLGRVLGLIAPTAYLGWLGLTAVAHWRKLERLEERVAGLTGRLNDTVVSFQEIAGRVLSKLDDIEDALTKGRTRR